MAIYQREPSLTGASNAGGIGKNWDSEPISGFTACCQRCNWPGVINMMSPDHSPASYNNNNNNNNNKGFVQTTEPLGLKIQKCLMQRRRTTITKCE